jgi:hypothetical protein
MHTMHTAVVVLGFLAIFLLPCVFAVRALHQQARDEA